MNIIMKRTLIVALLFAAQMAWADAPKESVELFRTDGDISQADSGWTYQAGSDEEMVYIPFEGVYPNKGGRMQSPWFTIPENDLGAYYRLTFRAKAAEHCYWWLDYRDKDGQPVPDCNSEVYVGEEFRDYDEVVYVQSKVREVQIAFVSRGKVEVKNIRFATATAEEAAQWCDDLYKSLPPIKFTAPPESMALLPRTVAAMNNGTPWRVVMLGNSIMNDSFNSLFMALVQRDFPKARLDVVASVRGSTGCSYFRRPDAFPQYVVAQKPDLLMVRDSTGGEALASIVNWSRQQTGCEVLVISNPLSGDWREDNNTLDWRSLMDQPNYTPFNTELLREWTDKLNVAFWDVTTPCNDCVASAPNLDFTRDGTHNNDAGKQIIGRVLHQYFRTAMSAKSTLRVLFIGNSQMMQYDLPQMVATLAESAPADRPRLIIGRGLAGGMSLKKHWEAGEGPGTARAMIASPDGWDYVVLQDIYAHWGNKVNPQEFEEYAGKFDDAIKQAGAKTIVFPSASVTEFTIPEFRYPDAFRELNDVQIEFAKKRGLCVAAGGYAWMKYLGPDPSVEQRLDLYDKDKGHPGPKGSYIYACLLYAAITGGSPEGLTHEFKSIRGGVSIPKDEAVNMQKVAWEQYQEDKNL